MSKHFNSCLLKLSVMIGAVLIMCFVSEAALRLVARSRWSLFVSPTHLQAVNKAGAGADTNFPIIKSMQGGIYWEPDVKMSKEMRENFLMDYYNRFFDKKLLHDQKRIVLLGDSIGYGFVGEQNRPKNFSSLLEDYLNATQPGGLGYAVANLSCGSYSTFQEAIAFERRGLAFSPHLVLLEFTMNDFSNFVYSDRHPRYTTRRGTYVLTLDEDVIPLSLPLPRRLNEFLCRHSMLFRFSNLRTDVLRGKWGLRRGSAVYNKTREQALNALDKINKLARANGSKFLVVFFPLTDKPFAEHSSKEYPYNEIVAFAAKHDIPVFDLIAAMRDVDYKAVRLDSGGHLSETGHRVVAEKLFDYLKKHPELLNSKPAQINIGSNK